jgi:hypothetical protein
MYFLTSIYLEFYRTELSESTLATVISHSQLTLRWLMATWYTYGIHILLV